MMNNNEKFQQLKKKIDNLNVRKLASESQAKRLEQELQKSKLEIKQIYGVQINDFAKAIETMKKQYESNLMELEKMVLEAEMKIGEQIK